MSEIFAKRLLEKRTEKGLSQEKLAEIVGLTQQAVQKWEKGKAEPDMETIFRMASFFGCSVYDLWGKEPIILKEEKSIYPIKSNNEIVDELTKEELDIVKISRRGHLTKEDIEFLVEVKNRIKTEKAES